MRASSVDNQTLEPRIIPRPDHNLSRRSVSENALKVLYRLKDCGYQAHLVGGCVRDLLLGHQPKDFDVATDATPEQVRRAFRNCRLIGRRFRLAHIHFGRDYIEVATFRGTGDNGDERQEGPGREFRGGRMISDNIFGTIEEDAVRRDFTVNALYYNIRDFSVLDYCGGYRDLKDGVLRLIGDPEARYHEDPVRLLRAVRFAAKLDFRIETASEEPIYQMGGTLGDMPPARLFDEVLKLFLTGCAKPGFEMLRKYRLLGSLFPDTAPLIDRDEGYLRMLRRAMANTDQRVAEDKPVTPAFLFAVLLWPPLEKRVAELENEGMPWHDATHQAAEELISRQVSRIALPRRFSVPMRDIWHLQARFDKRQGKKAMRLLEHPRFRAAYDFLLMRTEYDPSLQESADYWTEVQELSGRDLKQRLFPNQRSPRKSRGGRSGKSSTDGS